MYSVQWQALQICKHTNDVWPKYLQDIWCKSWITRHDHNTGVTRAVKKFLSSRLIMNCRRLWNSHQSHKVLGLRRLGTFWNLESQKWCFQGFSRGIFHRAHHVVSSQNYTCKRGNNVPGVPQHHPAQTDLNLFKYAFNVTQNWEMDALQSYS